MPEALDLNGVGLKQFSFVVLNFFFQDFLAPSVLINYVMCINFCSNKRGSVGAMLLICKSFVVSMQTVNDLT